ncbi:MAG: zf-TFIIB domain-containing protein [Calditrichaceae bacterium]
MQCPVCHKSMIILEYHQVEIDYCPSCGGCWLDQGELELMLELGDNIFDLTKFHSAPKGKRRCPRCRKKLRTDTFPDTRVEVDICPYDGGIWLDGGELMTIAKLDAGNSAIRKLNDFFKNMIKE